MDSDTHPSGVALEYVKSHKHEIIAQVLSGYEPTVGKPLAVFMAGTPGAGKTEVAKTLVSLFTNEPVRIDADELRKLMPGYNGSNASTIQPAAVVALEKVLDATIAKHLPFILDATFAVGKATMNIKRVLRKQYEAQIYFVYQEPEQAWTFTKIREQKEGRNVPLEAFVSAYYKSRENVRKVKQDFGDEVIVHVIQKNYVTGETKIYNDIDDIDKCLPKLYNKSELIRRING